MKTSSQVSMCDLALDNHIQRHFSWPPFFHRWETASKITKDGDVRRFKWNPVTFAIHRPGTCSLRFLQEFVKTCTSSMRFWFLTFTDSASYRINVQWASKLHSRSTAGRIFTWNQVFDVCLLGWTWNHLMDFERRDGSEDRVLLCEKSWPFSWSSLWILPLGLNGLSCAEIWHFVTFRCVHCKWVWILWTTEEWSNSFFVGLRGTYWWWWSSRRVENGAGAQFRCWQCCQTPLWSIPCSLIFRWLLCWRI